MGSCRTVSECCCSSKALVIAPTVMLTDGEQKKHLVQVEHVGRSTAYDGSSGCCAGSRFCVAKVVQHRTGACARFLYFVSGRKPKGHSLAVQRTQATGLVA